MHISGDLGPWVRIPIRFSVDFHVVPTADEKDHDLTIDCPCIPKIETEKDKRRRVRARAIIHNAWDNRPGPLS